MKVRQRCPIYHYNISRFITLQSSIYLFYDATEEDITVALGDKKHFQNGRANAYAARWISTLCANWL